MRRVFYAVSFILLISFCLSVPLLSYAQEDSQEVIVDEALPADEDWQEPREEDVLREQEEAKLRKEIEAITLNEDGSINQSRLGQAIEQLEQYLSVDGQPAFEVANVLLADCYFNVGDFEKALELSDIFLELSPDECFYYLFRAECLLALARTDEAVAAFEKAIEIEEDPVTRENAYLYIARIYKNEVFSEFLDVMGKVFELNPESVDMHILYGDGYTCVGEIETAEEHFDMALELDPENSEAYAFRGLMWGRSGNFEKAVEDFNSALEYDSDNVIAYALRARAYYVLEEYEKSLSDLTTLIEFDDAEAFSYYFERAKLYYFAFDDKEKALADIDAAIELNPEISILSDFRNYITKN